MRHNLSLRAFSLRIFQIDLVLILVIALPSFLWFASIHGLAALTSILVTSINALIGYYYIDRYFHAPMDEFTSFVYGSMFIRLATLGALIFIILALGIFPQITFILSLFISYISKSVLEIIFINKKSTKHDKS